MEIGEKFFPVRKVQGENKNAEARGDADGAPLMGDQTRSTDLAPTSDHKSKPAVSTEMFNLVFK